MAAVRLLGMDGELAAGLPEVEAELDWLVFGAEAEWHAVHRISQDVPELATRALIAGWDSPSLRVLAGEPANTYLYDLGELLAKTLLELDRPAPSREDAIWRLVQFVCWQMRTARVGPINAARRIERIG